jgi:hypothetical protein
VTPFDGTEPARGPRFWLDGRILPSRSKQNCLDILGFIRPIRDFSTGCDEKNKKLALLSLRRRASPKARVRSRDWAKVARNLIFAKRLHALAVRVPASTIPSGRVMLLRRDKATNRSPPFASPATIRPASSTDPASRGANFPSRLRRAGANQILRPDKLWDQQEHRRRSRPTKEPDAHLRGGASRLKTCA